MIRILVLSVALFSFATDAAAQRDLARERVSLQFKDTPIAQVFPALAKSLGYQISLDPALRAFVTLQVVNVTAQTALTAICESVGCRWRQEGNRLIVDARTDLVAITRLNEKGEQFARAGGNLMNYSLPSLDDRLPFDITWSPVDLEYAFVMLVRMTGADTDIDPALRGRRIAVNIRDGTLREALNAVCAVASCRWELVEKPKRIVRVTGGEPLGRVAEREAQDEARRVYDKNEKGVTPPRPITQANPRYTPDAMRAKIQGFVKLSCVVDVDGTPTDVQVVGSLDPGLDQEAVKTLRQWRFTPGTKDGRPVPVRVEMEFAFTLR